ncbi:hypothetical protein N7539_007551 [Penicillium diatomitis]|uniref:Vacuolar import and degradation protein-domain-containing protein n=1 Tax=Penicillium diatomitis TaxID=2819901 RepID=A0A9W9WVP4_9EURO|nr:uncharacterized protein N7539_007551 [Penicillium diatomitis]KAJ5477407.1 hypothetical protein N7539_007551 [Penicillium diatomitis]
MPPPNSASHGTPVLSPTSRAPVPAPETEPPSRRRSLTETVVSLGRESDDAHDENVDFLRNRAFLSNPPLPSMSRRPRRGYGIPHLPQVADLPSDDRMDLDNPSSTRLSVEINHRMPIVHDQSGNQRAMPNYENRRANIRSLYGWAPGSDGESEDNRHEEPEDELVRPFLHAASGHSEISNREVGGDTEHRASAAAGSVPNNAGRWMTPPIPMDVLLSARRQPNASQMRTLERFLLDRYGSQPIDETADTERGVGSPSTRVYRYRPPSRGDFRRGMNNNELRARVAANRQSIHSPAEDSLLKDTIKYLDRLRYSNSFEESISSAAATGFISLENFSLKDNDLLLDIHAIGPPERCSWLQEGMVFEGCQKAANAGGSALPQRAQAPRVITEPVIVNGSDGTRISVHTLSGRRYLANTARDENWPVKVTIHSINYADMTLSGTMEAYNIPDKSSPNRDAHIITFLEGEIIDFNQHTLETKNFKADADIDSTYWRELQPFKDLSDAEISKNLVSKKWITEQLLQGWILMRWKERCFITPTDARQGLTISGFYYISLRREDGRVEGLYYDPGSSPYQQLSLKPKMARIACPSYSFR